jgi:glycosyltransferase involved in cell wall biosynthesis
MANKKIIGAHVLVKNEARWLWYSVSSVIDHINKVLLWDTGSTDGTLEIIEGLIRRYPGKVDFKQCGKVTLETFTEARQEMLRVTKADWFVVLDADEIWWDDSIKKVVDVIQKKGKEIESIVVPNILPVGDIFHRQEEAAGRYKIAGRVGHFNLRAVNVKIPGLRVSGSYGRDGWVDGDNKMIQDRDPKKIAFVEAPYLHVTYLPRTLRGKDSDVIKREMKLKHEIGRDFPYDFYYPEVFFRPRPKIVESPWKVMDTKFKLQSFIETPLRKIKRRIWWGKPGY